jgi:hypothetical protein
MLMRKMLLKRAVGIITAFTLIGITTSQAQVEEKPAQS